MAIICTRQIMKEQWSLGVARTNNAWSFLCSIHSLATTQLVDSSVGFSALVNCEALSIQNGLWSLFGFARFWSTCMTLSSASRSLMTSMKGCYVCSCTKFMNHITVIRKFWLTFFDTKRMLKALTQKYICCNMLCNINIFLWIISWTYIF